MFPVASPFRLRVSHHFDRATFPVPATSNAACGFPTLRSPACFTSRVMGPILLGRLSGRVRTVDLSRSESFGFLGFDFRRIRSGRGVRRASFTPKLKKRTALLRKLKDVFRRHQSQPVDRVISLINPILRGWVNYFAVGHASECFGYIQDWVEKKIGVI